MSYSYSGGFALDLSNPSSPICLFIQKLHQPKNIDFLAGKLSCIGGKIEEDETPLQAMVREFEEETGIKSQESDWTPEANLFIHTSVIYFFSSRSIDIYQAKTTTDEKIRRIKLSRVFSKRDKFVRDVPLILSIILDESELIKPIALWHKSLHHEPKLDYHDKSYEGHER